MKCVFCGYEYNEDEGKKGCGGCQGGCHAVHCPRCNYKNPLEPGFVKSIRNIFRKKDQDKGEKR